MFWKKQQEKRTEGIAWFSYSVLLPERTEDENEMTVMGNFTIKNTGNTPLHHPYICLRIKPRQSIRLGGKIGALTHTALMIDGTNAGGWQYIHENWKQRVMESGEHWLKPNGIDTIMPNETITFSHEGQISLHREEKHAAIEGFFYSDEFKDGLPALNSIMINF